MRNISVLKSLDRMFGKHKNMPLFWIIADYSDIAMSPISLRKSRIFIANEQSCESSLPWTKVRKRKNIINTDVYLAIFLATLFHHSSLLLESASAAPTVESDSRRICRSRSGTSGAGTPHDKWKATILLGINKQQFTSKDRENPSLFSWRGSFFKLPKIRWPA